MHFSGVQGKVSELNALVEGSSFLLGSAYFVDGRPWGRHVHPWTSSTGTTLSSLRWSVLFVRLLLRTLSLLNVGEAAWTFYRFYRINLASLSTPNSDKDRIPNNLTTVFVALQRRQPTKRSIYHIPRPTENMTAVALHS